MKCHFKAKNSRNLDIIKKMALVQAPFEYASLNYQFRRNVPFFPVCNEWQDMKGEWDLFPNALRAIDGTCHEINRFT